MEREDPSQTLIARDKTLRAHLQHIQTQRCQLWRQKFRCRNIKERDQNTSYFHIVTLLRRKRNEIKRLQIGDRVFKNLRVLKVKIVDHFKDLYSQPIHPNIFLPNNALRKISTERAIELELLLDNTKVKEAVWSCDGGQFPGYDGYNLNFIKQMWEFLGPKIYYLVRNFLSSRSFPLEINTHGLYLYQRK